MKILRKFAPRRRGAQVADLGKDNMVADFAMAASA